MNRAGEIARLREITRGTQQHGGVPVMAAAMHLALVPGAVAEGVGFLHVQRVHVRAQADGAAVVGLCSLQCPYHAGAGQPAMHVVSELGELAGNEIGGAELLERRLGMGVQVAAPGRHLVVKIRDPIDDGHDALRAPWLQRSQLIRARPLRDRPSASTSRWSARLEAVRRNRPARLHCAQLRTVACRGMGHVLACDTTCTVHPRGRSLNGHNPHARAILQWRDPLSQRPLRDPKAGSWNHGGGGVGASLPQMRMSFAQAGVQSGQPLPPLLMESYPDQMTVEAARIYARELAETRHPDRPQAAGLRSDPRQGVRPQGARHRDDGLRFAGRAARSRLLSARHLQHRRHLQRRRTTAIRNSTGSPRRSRRRSIRRSGRN